MNKTVAIVVFAGVQSLDVSGPMDVFAEANRFLAPEDHYRLEVIGVEHGLMACSNGLSLNAHRHFSEALDAYDLLLVAGGPQLPFMDFGATFDGWLREACARAQRFGSICNGAFMLARAGLLEGRTSPRTGTMPRRWCSYARRRGSRRIACTLRTASSTPRRGDGRDRSVVVSAGA
jgi:transcriptional regulator GlxA family with amidase domain